MIGITEKPVSRGGDLVSVLRSLGSQRDSGAINALEYISEIGTLFADMNESPVANTTEGNSEDV